MGLSPEQRQEQEAAAAAAELAARGIVVEPPPAELREVELATREPAPAVGTAVVNITADTSELEAALEKAEQLAAALQAAQDLAAAAKPLKTPDVTPVQARAFAVAVATFGAAIGLPVGAETQDALMTAAIAFPTVLVIADAVIRFGRAKYLAAKRG